MEKDKYLEITNTVYKIIDFFPDEEPLKKKTKEKALEIMENLVLVCLSDNPHPNPQKGEIASQVLEDIEVLKSYLNLGKSLGWIDNLNLLILFKEYDRIKEEIEPIIEKNPKGEKEKNREGITSQIPVNNNVNKEKSIATHDVTILSRRQQEIIKILEVQKKAQVADFKKFLPDVTKRTLRRDLDDLLKKRKVIRVGEWNQVFYQLPENSRGLASGNKETLPMVRNNQNNQKVDGTALMS